METKKQQFERLFRDGKVPGKVLFRPILMHFAARYNGRTYGEFASDHKILVDCNLRALEDFDIDLVSLISDPYRETSAFGAPVEFVPEGVPKLLKTIVNITDDLNDLKLPDVYRSERTLDRIKGAERFQQLLKGTVPVIGWIEGPLAEACDLAGISEMLMQLMMEPDFSNKLLDICTQVAKDFAKAQINAGCDVIGMGDAICSQIDADVYNEFVRSKHQEIIEFIHSLGARVKLHICGNIAHLLPSIATVKPDILDLDWQVDIDKARKIMGEDTVLCGNINPVTIQDENPESLYEMAGRLASKYANEKYILSGGCEITVNTSPENLKALRRASLF